jgi:two-component system chemotaxis sensor kinase CheA
MDDLLSDFIAETRETLETLASEIVVWEAQPSDRSRLDSIFRFVHTVKGSCGFLDLPRLEKLSHAAEDVLADCRADRRKPDAALVSAVLSIIDRIAELTNALETGESVPDHQDAALIAALAPKAEKVENVSGNEADSAVNVAPPPVPTNTNRTVSRSIRLPVDLLDRMMAGVSDMVLARNDLARRLRETGANPSIDTAFERLSTCVAEMRDSITRTRMARIENLFSALPRMVRDLTSELGKQVALEIDGGDVELDREMIEMIRDPLTHIVRNAIDHGIELPVDRVAAGKPATGRLRVSARQAGNQIVIEAVDDGRGIDGQKLAEKAITNGILTREKAATMTAVQKLQLIFAAGLSTAKEVTSISGRGVGMDVVRANVERIGGLVDIDSRPGQGLKLSLRVPLTLTIIPALTVSVADRFFAIPRSAIEELVRVNAGSARLSEIGGAMMCDIRGNRLPVVLLSPFLGLGEHQRSDQLTLVVLKPAGGDHFALAVDAVHDHEELVVKPAAPTVMATGIYAGTTLPDNSHPMLLLDPAGIAARAGILASTRAEEPIVEESVASAEELTPTLIFRDLDGAERALPLALVERIEDVPAEAASFSAGRMRIAHDGNIIPLLSCGAELDQNRHRLLRLTDGDVHVAYAISEVVDIIPLSSDFERAPAPGMIAGVALIEGRPVELLDSFWLFSEASRDQAHPLSPPLCLLADADDPWTRQVLKPLIEQAGYRVAFAQVDDAPDADIIIDSGAGRALQMEGNAPVLRLSRDPRPTDPQTIYRYDRERLLNTLRDRTQGRRYA